MEETSTPLISAGETRQLMNDASVVIIDARGGSDAYARYQAAHLEGAAFLDLERDLSEKGVDAAKGGRHPLPSPQRFGALLGEVGITPSKRVLVYDDKAGANAAARCWWMLRAAGHERVQVIDGGLQAIQQAGLPIRKGPAPPASHAAPYPVTGWKLPLVTMETVDEARVSPDAVVIDVREGYRYRGESEPIDLVAGHIPGAINIPYVDNLRSDGCFESPEMLREKYRGIGGREEPKKVIVHCGSGVTACHTLLAMEIARMPPAHLYVGSWSEWSRNEKPVATETGKT